MNNDDFINLETEELVELLATLEGIDDFLKEEEKIMEKSDNNEYEL